MILELPIKPGLGQALLLAAAEAVASTVTSGEPTLSDPMLAGHARVGIGGFFVSLKRGKHLRGCCGGIHEQPVPLGQALLEAAQRTVADDPRFPAVCPVELPYLTLEIWLLDKPKPTLGQGESRKLEVEVGRHGVVIQRGEQRGLLLPSVAIENEWTAEELLEHACAKAGIHPQLWRDNETRILLFEGEAFRDSLARLTSLPSSIPPVTGDDLEALQQFCLQNIQAMREGRLPNYYLSQAPDFNVLGLVLRVSPVNLELTRLTPRGGMPLQASLFSLCQEAARLMPQAQDLETVDVAIAWDMAMHGSLAEPMLEGIGDDRAILVSQRSRSGLTWSHSKTPMELVDEAARLARVSHPRQAVVYSLGILTTAQSLSVYVGPSPVPGASCRLPAVAGKFYPVQPAELRNTVDGLISGIHERRRWSAALVPHAGLAYSGRLAASVLEQIEFPRQIIVLGPKHTPHGMEWAIAPHDSWAIPGATIAADRELALRIASAIPELALDAEAHRQEHAIEVELPLLARLAPTSRVTGIVFGHADLDDCLRVARSLAELFRNEPERPLLVISSDMNHFATDEQTRLLDAIALDALESLDPKELFRKVRSNHISMCGLIPAVIVLETLRLLKDANSCARVGYATSADASGRMDRVVGYAGMLFE